MSDEQDKATEVIEENNDDGEENANENYGGFDPDDAVVKIAKRHGWTSKDQFNDPDKEWVSPDKYVDAQWDVNRSIKTGRERLENQVTQLTNRLDQLMRQQADVSQREIGKMQADIRAQRDNAIEAGDKETVHMLDERLAELAEKANTDVSSDASIDPDINEWMQEADWYKPEGRGAPNDVQDVIAFVEELNSLDEYQRLSPKFRLAKIDREVAGYVEMRRPDLIGKYHFNGIKPTKGDDGKALPKENEDGNTKVRRQIADVEGHVAHGGSPQKGKTLSNLNETERRAMESQIKAIPGMTEEKWLKDYNAKFNQE